MKRTYKSITDQQSSKEKSPHYYQLDRNLDNAKQSNTRDINNKHVSDLIDQYGGKTRTGGIMTDHRLKVRNSQFDLIRMVKKVMKLGKYVITLI